MSTRPAGFLNFGKNPVNPSPFSYVHFRNTTKLAVQVLALNFWLLDILLSFSLNYELIIYFCFSALFNHMDLSII